jgi:UDP-N-acetylmuramoyl-tripeptide--D-alanyl-D-alanine ligase
MATSHTTLTPYDLICGLAGEVLPTSSQRGTDEVRIQQAVIDSRLAMPGSMFVALRGQELDGNDFVADAFARGAVAAIAERAPPGAVCTSWPASEVQQCRLGDATCLVVPDSLTALQRVAAHWRRQHPVRVIGITGSVGKTISKEYIAAILRQRYRTLRSEGSYNNEIGLPLTLLHVTSLTERVVLEMGMYDTGEITQLADIAAPQVGVVTNVGPTHLERLGTIDRIARAKLELPQALPAAGEGGVAILNADDEWVQGMAGQTQARVFTYGLGPDADLWADRIESEGLDGIRLRFHHQGETVGVRVPMLGNHSAHTALCAAAVGLNEGLTWSSRFHHPG